MHKTFKDVETWISKWIDKTKTRWEEWCWGEKSGASGVKQITMDTGVNNQHKSDKSNNNAILNFRLVWV